MGNVAGKKSSARGAVVQATHTAAKALPQSLPVVDLPFMHERQDTYAHQLRLGGTRLPAVMTAMGFILLFMAAPALAADEVKPAFPRGQDIKAWCFFMQGGYSGDYGRCIGGNGDTPIIGECRKLENFIIQNAPEMKKEIELAKQYPNAPCPKDFPAFPSVTCPPADFVKMAPGNAWSNVNREWEAERITDTLIAFINGFNKKSEDSRACITTFLEAKQRSEKAETERRIAAIERRFAEQNAEIIRQNAEIIHMKTEEQISHALAVIKSVNEYMNEHREGRIHGLNPRYQEAFDFFLKNPKRCISGLNEGM